MTRLEARGCARLYVYGAISSALEMGDYDPKMMDWDRVDHGAVMEAVAAIRDRFKGPTETASEREK